MLKKIVKKCDKHGSLTAAECYKSFYKDSKYYSCKECVKKKSRLRSKKKTEANKRLKEIMEDKKRKLSKTIRTICKKHGPLTFPDAIRHGFVKRKLYYRCRLCSRAIHRRWKRKHNAQKIKGAL